MGMKKLAPELAPDEKGEAGFSRDVHLNIGRQVLDRKALRVMERKRREGLRRISRPLP
jgi:hypothetical protein